VSGGDFRARVAEALAGGARLGTLYAAEDAGQPIIRAVVFAPDGTAESMSAAVRDGQAPSIVDIAPAAEWAEREAHDLRGVAFDGHEPLRPLVEHTPELSSWTVPVNGGDAYQVAVGPIHAGVIESGHFRFHVVGDRILYLDARLFYKHRGLERAAEGMPIDDAIVCAARACGGCAVTNRVAYAHAAEQLRGLRPSADVARARTVLLELERLWNHLNDIAAVCAGVGLAAGNQRFAALCEEARRLNAELAGHRLLFDTVQVGGSRLALDEHQCRSARGTLARVRTAVTASWRELVFNTSFQDRLIDVGVLARADARDWGAVGPAARAAGLAEDARADSGELLAYDGFEPARNERPAGDVRARLEQRELELHQTLAILERLLEQPIAPGSCAADAPPLEVAVARVESPRGATVCALERSGGRIARLHLRTGSYANWPVLARVAQGNLLPDFPLINKSFELCYACADR
jgi:Ni,Fe-hydrogenase III large subunit